MRKNDYPSVARRAAATIATMLILSLYASCAGDPGRPVVAAAPSAIPETAFAGIPPTAAPPTPIGDLPVATPASSAEVIRPAAAVPANSEIEPPATPGPSPSENRPNGTLAKVLRVIDGDTIEVDIAGTPTTIRYIGVDTPETVHPTRGEEPFGREASAANKEMVQGRTVLLVKDVSETDRYGRLLRYVFVEEPTGLVFVNLELVRLGFAHASSYPPDVAHQADFAEAERLARESAVGLWGPGAGSPEQGSEPSEYGEGGCDPAYPGVCIPPSPPDLDCGEITYRRFQVLPPDPHRFDSDGDGVGCES